MLGFSRLFIVLALSVNFFIASFSFKAHADKFEDTIRKLDDANKPDPQSVNWDDVKGWKFMGERWAGGLDGTGNVIAIYDLSSPEMMNRIPFGLVGGKKISKHEIIEAIRESKTEPGTDITKADQAIHDLEQTQAGPIQDGGLPENWWVQVPWLNKSMGLVAHAPHHFKLSEINFKLANKHYKKFQRAIERVENVMGDLEEPGFGKQFMSQFEFVANAGGGYTMYWNPSPAFVKSVSRPRKLADLKSPRWGYFRALKVELLNQALGEAASFIPVPIASALVRTAIARFFHFYQLVNKTQANMFVEALASSQEANGPFANLPLTAGEYKLALQGIVYSASSAIDGWKWVVGNADKEWAKNSKQNADYAMRSAAWMQDHNIKYAPINARFARVSQAAKDNYPSYYVMLSRAKPSKKKGPQVALNELDPDTIRKARIREEIMATAVDFGAYMIPSIGGIGVSGVITFVYHQFVELRVDNSKAWEGRLTAVLEDQATAASDNGIELTLLDSQRVNPFFTDRQSMLQLIAARKLLLKP